ncbi:hypothetical protein QTO34_002355 [Cnephaeus nilssonii]|uniref:Uncharacterized protein n=1 Tax=Cnephaeus nilssonii TaxID=3371016 RepID=A0AA40HVL4_CNENI|nr:hypothetical protein QTO34_002355 [Eptesicus nilssonii]
MLSYGTNSVDLFKWKREAGAGVSSGSGREGKTKGLQSGVDIGIKHSEQQQWSFDDATTKAGQCAIGLQVGTNSVPASQA